MTGLLPLQMPPKCKPCSLKWKPSGLRSQPETPLVSRRTREMQPQLLRPQPKGTILKQRRLRTLLFRKIAATVTLRTARTTAKVSSSGREGHNSPDCRLRPNARVPRSKIDNVHLGNYRVVFLYRRDRSRNHLAWSCAGLEGRSRCWITLRYFGTQLRNCRRKEWENELGIRVVGNLCLLVAEIGWGPGGGFERVCSSGISASS